MSSLARDRERECKAVDVWMVLGLAHSDARHTEPSRRPFYNCYQEVQAPGAAQPDVDEGAPDAGARQQETIRRFKEPGPSGSPRSGEGETLDTVFDDGYTYPFSDKTVSEAMTSLSDIAIHNLQKTLSRIGLAHFPRGPVKMGIDDRFGLACDMAQGLIRLFSSGMTHNDVTPRNVFWIELTNVKDPEGYRAGRRIVGFLGDFESRKVSDAVSRFSLPRLGAVSQRRGGSPS